ncbi:hypothetical protein [Clostridium saccharoperbutylacetonicum]
MKNKFIKSISLFASCFALILALNAATTKTTHSNLPTVHLDESAPWG